VGAAVGAALPDGSHHLFAMWVAAPARGTGVADDLVGAVKAWAVERGAPSLVLDVTEGNEAARRLYERHGFVATGASDALASHPELRNHELRLDLA
jgi:ribosomal protein S18 acetylase RimI-like enzyme